MNSYNHSVLQSYAGNAENRSVNLCVLSPVTLICLHIHTVMIRLLYSNPLYHTDKASIINA